MSVFAAAATDYLTHGWDSPLPLGAKGQRGKKAPVPKGFTGYSAAAPSGDKIDGWCASHPDNNIGVHLGPGIIGLDVDHYTKVNAAGEEVVKLGGDHLDALEAQLGELPPTVRSTARGVDNPSGIRFYRVPTNEDGSALVFVSAIPGTDIEVIQASHRYAVVWPSEHPEGGTYTWYRPDGTELDRPPNLAALPELPIDWMMFLLSGAKSTRTHAAKATSTAAGFAADEAREWVRAHGAGTMCRAVRLVLRAEKAKLTEEGSRYDHAVEGSMAIVRLIGEGHRGGAEAIAEFGAAYLEAVADEDNRDTTEWPRMVTGAVAAVVAEHPDPEAHGSGKCPKPEAPDDPSLWPAPSEPYAVAQRFVRELHMNAEDVTLRFWRGSFYGWTGSHWEITPDDTLKAQLYGVLADATYMGSGQTPTELKWKPDRSKVGNVLDSLRAVCHRPEHEDETHDGGVAFVNGVLDLVTREISPHSPKRFNMTMLPYPAPTGRTEPCERWLAFLDALWPGDAEAIELLQEWFGYVLSGDDRFQKMLLMVGPTRSGKGTIARVLTAMVGRRNVAGPTLAQLATNFGMASLIGKTLAVIGDARFNGQNMSVVVERLLAITGGDSLDVDRKNRDMWHGPLAGARFMVLSNEVPALMESSGALAARFVGPLVLSQSFLGREDLRLEVTLLEELPGIVLWALDGYDRLREQHHFTRPSSSLSMQRELEELGSPVKSFMRERCVPDEEAAVSYQHLYDSFRMWCEDNGRDRPPTLPIFIRNLRSAYPQLRFGQSRTEGRKVVTNNPVTRGGGHGVDPVTGRPPLVRVMWGARLLSPEEVGQDVGGHGMTP